MPRSPVISQRQAIEAVLDQVEQTLRDLDLWEHDRPPPERLASRQPFAFDTLQCHQWLQWQFIPRMRRILRNGAELPAQSAILPYAEECFRAHAADAAELLFTLQLVDELICGRSPSLAN